MNNVPQSARDTVTSGILYPPSPLEDLSKGIRYMVDWLSDPHLDNKRFNAIQEWLHDAHRLMGPPGPMPPAPGPMTGLDAWLPKPGYEGLFYYPSSKPSKLPPMNCVRCNLYNEYVGPEHLVDGKYLCRSCK